MAYFSDHAVSALLVDGDQSLTPAADGKKSSGESKMELMVTDVGPNLSRLWSYQCPMTKGRNVSCIGWNSTNEVCQTVSEF